MKKIASLLLVLMCLSVASKAQQGGIGITSSLVSVFNNSQSELSFLLGYPTNLKSFKIKPQQVWYSPSFLTSPIIKIETQGITTEYQLKLGKAYMIYWNARKKLWDVKKIRERSST